MLMNRILGAADLGAVYALACAPSGGRESPCFAATDGGLFCSTDGGLTWQFAWTSLGMAGHVPATAVAISPDFPHDRTLFVSVSGGILRSHDGGKTWHAALLSNPSPVVSALAVSPRFVEDGLVFAATLDDGVFRSSDRGARWVAYNFGLLDLHVNCLALSPHYAEDETVFVGTESGIFRSTNGALAWREVDFPMHYAPVLSLAVADDADIGPILLVGTQAAGLFRSCDGGKSWQCVVPGDEDSPIHAISVLQPDGGIRHAVATYGSGLLRSVDGGETWIVQLPNDPEAAVITSLVAPAGCAPSQPLLLGLAQGGVRRV